MVYNVCHSVYIIWTYYLMVKPHCPNFRIITAVFWVSEFLGFLWFAGYLLLHSDQVSMAGYCKNPKTLDTQRNFCNYLKIGTVLFYNSTE